MILTVICNLIVLPALIELRGRDPEAAYDEGQDAAQTRG